MIEKLLPEAARACVSTGVDDDLPLFPQEESAAANFAAKRRREFAHGRDCARQALAHLGVAACAIGVGESREPLWPAGIVGSITHADGFVAAAVARVDAVAGLGIDCEQTARMDERILQRIALPEELSAAATSPLHDDYGAVLFSAKESVYKSIWPSVQQFVGFHDVAVSIDTASARFTAAAASDKVAPQLLARLQGRWAVSDGYVYTVTVLLPEAGIGPATD